MSISIPSTTTFAMNIESGYRVPIAHSPALRWLCMALSISILPIQTAVHAMRNDDFRTAERNPTMPIISFERKPLLRYLAPYFPVYVFTEKTFRFGISQPIPGMDLQRSIESRIDILAGSLLFEVPTKNLIRSVALYELQKRETLNGSGNYPALSQIHRALQGWKLHALSREKRSQETACNRIDGMLKALGDIFSVATGFLADVLNQISFSLELPQCNPEYRRLLVSMVMNEIFQYRFTLWQRGIPLELLTVIIDEISEIASRHLEATSITQGNQSTLTELFTMGRELKIRIIALSQSGGKEDVSHALLDNTGVKVLLGGTGSADVLAEFTKTLGCNDPEHVAYMNTHRDPGTGFVNDIHYPHPFHFEFPYLPFKDIGVSEELIQARLAEILPRMKVTDPKPRWWRKGMPVDVQPSQQTSDDAQQASPAPSNAPMPKTQTSDIQLPQDAMNLLRALVQREIKALSKGGNPQTLAGLRSIWDDLKVSSGRAKKALMTQLSQANLIVEHLIRRGRSNISLVEITDRGWALAGKFQPKLPGKGKWLHRVVARAISDYQTARGWSCDVEGRLTSSAPSGAKQADILCRTPEGSLVAIEIALSIPFSKEISNAKLDLIGTTPVDKLIFIATTTAMLDKVKKAIEITSEIQHVADRITYQLAGEYFS